MAVSEEQNQQETNHSINESELEQYGVWVKAGPEDVIETEAEDEAFTLDDLSEDVLGETAPDSAVSDMPMADTPGDAFSSLESLEESNEPAGADDLSDELEEVSLDTFEVDTEIDEPGSLPDEELVELTIEDDEPVASGSDDDLETLDLDLGEDLEPAELDTDESDLLTLEEDDLTVDLSGQSDDLGMDIAEDTGVEAEAIAAEPLDDLGDLEEDLSLEELTDEPLPVAQAALDESVSASAGVVDDDLNMEEDLPDDLNDLALDLDSLDVDAFEEPKVGASEEPDLDLSGSVVEDEGELTELTLDDELDTDLGAEEPELLEAELSEPEADDLLSLDEELSMESETASLDDLEGDDMVLDLVEVGEEMPESVLEEVAPAAASDDRSVSLLENIERELSSIRSELGDLKRELGELRTMPAAAQPEAAVPTDEDDAGGFFAETEDDDETIALTGAELDNIMNNAVITEETGKPTEIDDLVPSTAIPTLDELLPEADESAMPVTEISLEEAPQEIEPIEIDLDSSDSVVLVGSDEEVEALASMDIDAELADIEELEDVSESIGDVTVDDVILDAEPLDELDLSETVTLDLATEPEPEPEPFPEEPTFQPAAEPAITPIADATPGESVTALPDNLKGELRSVLSYMDQLLESLPEEKIQEFAQSDHFTVYRRLFEELGLEQ